MAGIAAPVGHQGLAVGQALSGRGRALVVLDNVDGVLLELAPMLEGWLDLGLRLVTTGRTVPVSARSDVSAAP